MDVTGLDVWVADVEDRAGALAERLNALAASGLNLEFVVSQRGPEGAGPVRVFVAPIKGAKQMKAARGAGFEKASIRVLRVEAKDRAGLLAEMAQAIGAHGVNMRGAAATVAGRQAIAHLGFNSADDAKKAAKALKAIK